MLIQAPIVELPKASWPEGFFGGRRDRQSIVGRAAIGGYGNLQKHLLPPADEEVRVWGGFGLSFLQAVILRREAGKWTAVRLLSAIPGTSKAGWKKRYAAPKSGWPVFWKKAEALGIWTLPDDSTLPQKYAQHVFDGYSYVVEIQRGGRYRAYRYANPDSQKHWPEAKRMVLLDRLLEREFPHPTP